MIFKKPYAFIIKHFRILNLLMLMPIIYLITKTGSVSRFLSSYIKNGYVFDNTQMISGLANHYINILMYLAILMIIVIVILFISVLQKKEKSSKFYRFILIYYIVLIIFFTAGFSIFTMIERNTLTEIMARLFRDISWIIYYSEYVLAFLVFIRGIGFNVKTFSFKKDLEGLQISTEDSEEFELFVKKDGYKTKRNIRRFIREFGYYYQENKFIITIVIIVAVIFLSVSLYRGREIVGRTYHEGESIPFGYINFSVKESFVSLVDMNGNTIKENMGYVILKVNLNNRYREDKSFNYANVLLNVGNKSYAPNIYLANFFLNYGVPYTGVSVKGNTENNYIMVYEIPKNLINSKMIVSDYNKTKIQINPQKYSTTLVSNIVNKGTKISLNDTSLKDTKVAILGYDFMNRFLYTYSSCDNKNICSKINDAITIDYAKDNNKTLMILDYILELDETLESINNYKAFFESFASITYTINDKEYTYKVSIANPNNYNEKIIMKVPKEMANAQSIKVVLRIGNYQYLITLK